jgi:hypothetical protein
VNAVALDTAVAQDLPVLQPGQRVFHSGPGPAMDCVLRLLLTAEVRLTASFAVRDEQAGALVAAIGDGGSSDSRPDCEAAPSGAARRGISGFAPTAAAPPPSL